MRYHPRMRLLSLSALHRIAQARRSWLLWLALCMAAAHSLAIWHPYAHSAVELQRQLEDKKYLDLAGCGLCLAGASALGSVPPVVAALLPAITFHPVLPRLRLVSVLPAPLRQPGVIRAPPALAT